MCQYANEVMYQCANASMHQYINVPINCAIILNGNHCINTLFNYPII